MYKCKVKGCRNRVNKLGEYCRDCSDEMFDEIGYIKEEEKNDESTAN